MIRLLDYFVTIILSTLGIALASYLVSSFMEVIPNARKQ